jgi:hypothetical protein
MTLRRSRRPGLLRAAILAAVGSALLLFVNGEAEELLVSGLSAAITLKIVATFLALLIGAGWTAASAAGPAPARVGLERK